MRWWEGSVGVREERDSKRVQGRGYVPVEDHGGGVIGWLGQILSAHFLRDEALALLPACGRLVEGVEQLKPVLGNGLELLAQQNVLLRLVGEDEPELRLVLWVFQHGPNNLKHGLSSKRRGSGA